MFNRADFWGPASNFGIPIAAVMDTQKDPEMYVYLSACASACIARVWLEQHNHKGNRD